MPTPPREKSRTPPLPSLPPPTPKTSDRKVRQRKTAGKSASSASGSGVPVVQPYPFYMNHHPYPLNAPAYQQSAYPSSQSNSNPAPPPPPPPHYAYPMAPSPHSYYSPYQYPPQPMMMYGAPPPPPPAAALSPDPASPPTTTKRKRKSTGKDKASDDETPTADTPQQSQMDMKKRTKTQRACDSCRTRKIRCDILAESDPPICQHCKQYSFDCTFFLPITETRFKKKKIEAEDSTDKEKSDSAKLPSTQPPGRDVGVLGPTSTAHLLHSQPTISSRHYQGYDARYNHSFHVSKNGDGLISVQKPPNEDHHAAMSRPVDYRVERDLIEQLVNAYFTDVGPLLPVITQAEFLAHSSPPPILLYSMCLVAAARREVPQQVFDSIRFTVNSIIKSDDVLSTASIVNVQSLLILCMTGDCHSQFVPTALSALWIRLGAAIRMAQDLGLHRCESVKQTIELRRRLWGACLISDRWTSLTYGHPYMIDIQDCDARLPSSGDPNDLYMDELVRLSIILGRVQKALYTPAGLTVATDEMLNALLADLEAWKDNLPDNLKFTGPESPQTSGLLYLLYVCVSMMFWRVFMRISYSCPEHLKFGLTVELWSDLVMHTGQAIDWLDTNEKVYDVWLLVAYAAASCGFVQYHTFVRRKDNEAEVKLRKLRDCVRRWEKSISPDHMSARRKTAEIMALLYEATQAPPMPMEAPALNPTGGVKGKQPLIELDYRKDPTRPGGGVFVAHGKARGADYKDLPAGTVVEGSSDDEESEGETSINAVPLTSSSSNPTRAHLFSNSMSSPAFASSSSSNSGLVVSSLVHQQHQRLPADSSSTLPVTSQLGQGTGRAGGSASLAGTGAGAAGSMVNFTPLSGKGASFSNVNPAMNALSVPSNQVINILDMPHTSNTLAEFAMADNGFLEGIPNGMFDWSQWDTFFARFNPATDPTAVQPPRPS